MQDSTYRLKSAAAAAAVGDCKSGAGRRLEKGMDLEKEWGEKREILQVKRFCLRSRTAYRVAPGERRVALEKR